MKKLILLTLVLPVLVAAQCVGPCLTPTLSPTTALPGQSVTLSVNLSGQGLNAFQWDVSAGSLNGATPVIGPSAVALVPKVLKFNSADGRSVIVGQDAAGNSNSTQTGVVATQVFTVPASASAGTVTVGLSGAVGASVAGTTVPMTVGSPATLTIGAALPPPNPLDLNGDGVVNNLDFGLAMNQALGITPCTTADFSGPTLGVKDGKCDVTDLVFLAKQI